MWFSLPILTPDIPMGCRSRTLTSQHSNGMILFGWSRSGDERGNPHARMLLLRSARR